MTGAFGGMGTVMIAGVPGGLTVTLSGIIGMINLDMMVKLLLAIAVLVLLLRFNLTDNLLRRNLKPGSGRLITLGGIIAVIVAVLNLNGGVVAADLIYAYTNRRYNSVTCNDNFF